MGKTNTKRKTSVPKKGRRKTARQSYRAKLQHPRWQKLRLEVLERAGFACEWCGDTETNLQVHHGAYPRDRSREPWEVPLSWLHVLCDPCHERAETVRYLCQIELGKIPPRFHGDVLRILREIGELADSNPDALRNAQAEPDDVEE